MVGCCLLLGFGFTIPMLSFSVFLAPMAEAFQCSMTEVSLYFTFCASAAVFSSALGARVINRSMRLCVVVATFAMVVAYVLLVAFPTVPMVWFAGVINGLGFPLCTTVLAPIAINNWFSERQGTFIGVVFAMIGVFGMVLSPVFTALIASFGWRQALIVAAVLMLVANVFVAVFLLRQAPSDSVARTRATAYSTEVRTSVAQATTPTISQGTTPDVEANIAFTLAAEQNMQSDKQSSFIRTPAFLLCAIVALFSGFFGDFNSQLNAVSQKSGFDPVTAGFALSCASAGLMVGKIAMGWVKDKKGSSFAIGAGCAFGVVAFSLVVAGMALVSVPLLYVGCFLSGFCTCLGTLSPSLLSSEAFAPQNYARAVAYITAFCSLGMAVGIPFYSLTYDLSGSYMPVLVTCIGVPIVVALVATAGIRLGKRSSFDLR